MEAKAAEAWVPPLASKLLEEARSEAQFTGSFSDGGVTGRKVYVKAQGEGDYAHRQQYTKGIRQGGNANRRRARKPTLTLESSQVSVAASSPGTAYYQSRQYGYSAVDVILQRFQAQGHEVICPPHTSVELGFMSHSDVLGGRAEWARNMDMQKARALEDLRRMHALNQQRRPMKGYAMAATSSGKPKPTPTPTTIPPAREPVQRVVKKGGPRAHAPLYIVPSRPSLSRGGGGGFSGKLGSRIGSQWVSVGVHLASSGPESPHRPETRHGSRLRTAPPPPQQTSWRHIDAGSRPRVPSPNRSGIIPDASIVLAEHAAREQRTQFSNAALSPGRSAADAMRARSSHEAHRYAVEENTGYRRRESWQKAPSLRTMSYIPSHPGIAIDSVAASEAAALAEAEREMRAQIESPRDS